MKKINEMTLEELHEAEDILNSLLDHPMSDTAREWYAHQANKILEAIYEKDPSYKDFKAWDNSKTEAEVAHTKQEDEQVDPFCDSKQKENKPAEIEKSDNMDSIWDSGIDMVTREILNHLGGNK